MKKLVPGKWYTTDEWKENSFAKLKSINFELNRFEYSESLIYESAAWTFISDFWTIRNTGRLREMTDIEKILYLPENHFDIPNDVIYLDPDKPIWITILKKPSYWCSEISVVCPISFDSEIIYPYTCKITALCKESFVANGFGWALHATKWRYATSEEIKNINKTEPILDFDPFLF